MIVRRIEMILGILVAVWGVYVAGFYVKNVEFSPLLASLLVWIVLLHLGIAAATILVSRAEPFSPIWLWGCTIMLGITVLLTISIIGVWLLPSLLMATIAGGLVLLHDDSPRQAAGKR